MAPRRKRPRTYGIPFLFPLNHFDPPFLAYPCGGSGVAKALFPNFTAHMPGSTCKYAGNKSSSCRRYLYSQDCSTVLFAAPILFRITAGYAWALRLRDDTVPGDPCFSICAPLVSINGTDSQCTNSFIEQDAQCFDCGALLDPVTVPNQVQLAQTSLDLLVATCRQLGHNVNNVTVAGSFKGFASTTGGGAGASQTISQSQSGSAAGSASVSNSGATSQPTPTTPSASAAASPSGTTKSNGGNGPAQWTRVHVVAVGVVAAVLLGRISGF
ncbi:hypothetical protein B0H13DRAFT_2008046 [Mycena leptocephala]|nr:hypothetical protein B0H13DRAFT_2008046 [Mycena leptocephala]